MLAACGAPSKVARDDSPRAGDLYRLTRTDAFYLVTGVRPCGGAQEMCVLIKPVDNTRESAARRVRMSRFVRDYVRIGK